MASPSGQKFGQQVWVMIKNSEVVDNMDPGNCSSKVIDSDVTSVGSKPNDQETHLPINDFIIDYVNEDEDITSTQINALNAPQCRISLRTVNSSVMSSTIVDSAPSSSAIVDVAPSSSSIVDSAPSSSTGPAVQPSGSSSQDIISDQEQTLLKDLEHMGFEQGNLEEEQL